MGKVLKTVGTIVAVGALVATGVGAVGGLALGFGATAGIGAVGTLIGVSTTTLALAGAALSAVGGALSKSGPPVSNSTIDRLTTNLVLDTPRKIAFGHTALNTDIRYEEWWGANQEYFSRVIVVASHWVSAIEQIWFDSDLAWDAASGVQSKFAGYLWVGKREQATVANHYTNGWSGRWGASAAFEGCADIYLQFRVTGTNSKATSPFSSSIPSRVTIRGKGAPVYDPRRDSSAGGSGPMRWYDQSTWAFSADGVDIGRNPALQHLFYRLGWRINSKLAVGLGIPIDRIDLAAYMTAATLCEEQSLKVDGTYEQRYCSDGTFSEGDDPKSVTDALESAMNAVGRDVRGQFSLQVLHNDLAVPVIDFDDNDVLGDFTWTPGTALGAFKNVVKGRYTDPSDASLYQLVDAPLVKVLSLDGIDRTDTVDSPLIQSPSQKQRLDKQRLQRSIYGGTFAADFNAKGWAVADGDIVRLSFKALGFVQKLFRVQEGTIQPSGVAPLVLREEHPSIYAWDREEAPAVTGEAPIVHDPLNAPLVQAIGQTDAAALQIAVKNSWVVEATAGINIVAASADGTITVANHTRRYPDGHADVAVTGASVASGLPANTTVAVSYDDLDRVGGAVTYQVYQDDNDAFASAGHPGRHYVQFVTIPATGTATGGGGSAGGGRENYCVADDTAFLTANATGDGPGETKPASAVTTADRAWTQHEVTRAWGAYPVVAIDFFDADVFAADGLPRATADHQFDRDGWWKKAKVLGRPAGRARVARISIEGARTYVTVQPDGTAVLNHNIKSTSPEPDPGP